MMDAVVLAYTDTYVYQQDGSPLELLRQGAIATTPYWYVIDGQGNVVALTDQGGNVVDSYSYDQWGKPLSAQESVPQQLRYAGYWYDNETQWYWLTVRSYDPALERFLQPDPSEIEGLFSYAYAGDNPADRIDPSGLSTAASRSHAIPVPPQSGNLLTAHNNIESNVQVGSAQWNNEIAGGGAKPHGGMQGDLGSSPVPSVCGAGKVCQVARLQEAWDSAPADPAVLPTTRVFSCSTGLKPSHLGTTLFQLGASFSSVPVPSGIDLCKIFPGSIFCPPPVGGPGTKWSCHAKCNIEGSEPQCQDKTVEGDSSGYPNENEACKAAKNAATQKAPRGCYARHCKCSNCQK